MYVVYGGLGGFEWLVVGRGESGGGIVVGKGSLIEEWEGVGCVEWEIGRVEEWDGIGVLGIGYVFEVESEMVVNV